MAAISALKNINIAQSFEDAYKVKDITSRRMIEAIQAWFGLYFGIDGGGDSSQRIPCVIVDGLYKAAFNEYEYNLANEVEDDTIDTMLKNLDKCRRKAFQQTLIGGEGFLKPIIEDNNFTFSFINRSSFVVLERDAEGNITSIGTSQKTTKNTEQGIVYYTLLERRTVNNKGYLTIENKLFRSSEQKSLGTKATLTELPECAKLQPIYTFPSPLNGLGLIPLKMPMANCVDDSPDGISVYAAATEEILKLYRHERRADREYELTEPHLIVSEDIQRRDNNGNIIEIPEYITALLDADIKNESGLTIWNPKPNQEELEAREDQIKRAIEDIIGLRRGFLSKSEVREFTATEIISTTTKMAHLIDDLQGMWEAALPEALRVCSLLAKMYNLAGWTNVEPPEVAINWGDGILYDEEKEFNRLNLLAAQGNLKVEYLLGWYFNMPTEGDVDLAAIRKKYMPSVNDGTEGDLVAE